MKQPIGMQLLKGAVLVGGILGVFVASPILNAVSKEAQQPNAKEGQPAASQPTAAPQAGKTEQVTLNVAGMKNELDLEKIKKELRQNPGILSTDCNQKAGTCRVEISSSQVRKEDVAMLINKIGFQASVKGEEGKQQPGIQDKSQQQPQQQQPQRPKQPTEY